MEFRIADTFTDSLARLTSDEQKAVKTTAFDLQMNPSQPGLSFHRLDRAKDKNFWSVRVSGDVRLIVHRSESSLLLCYVGHHDDAYAWAERRKLETHPKTGAAQLVEIRETVKEIVVPRYIAADAVTESVVVRAPTPAKPPFASLADDELLGYGIPAEWLADVKKCTEESLLAVAEHLPAEAAESLLVLATGGKPTVSTPPAPSPTKPASPFEHPDAQRRFRMMANVEELERALAFPWEKWTVFLHPSQRQIVERRFQGPARVAGSAGTGKTIVALHRAVHLARQHVDARVLLTTFSETLANALRTKLKRLLSNEPRLAERIDVHAIAAIGLRLYKSHVDPNAGPATIATRATIRSLVDEAAKAVPDQEFATHFLLAEWEHVVDAWGLATWEAYRDVARLGRKTRLSEPQRRTLWSIFERVRAGLTKRSEITEAGLFGRLAAALAKDGARPFDFAVVDESQDLGVAHLRFLAALGRRRPDALFFSGDLGQRIFQQPFSWKELGIEVRGRSSTLRGNYRTSHQIRAKADRLLEKEITDVDGNVEERSRTVSVFNGPPPLVQTIVRPEAESAMVGAWLVEQTKDGALPHECAVFVRSARELPRAEVAAKAAGLPYVVLDEHVETRHGHLSIGTMHLAKGLEFRVVVVMACDDEILPSQERIESVGDDADLKEVYDTERQLLYVACTRARPTSGHGSEARVRVSGRSHPSLTVRVA
jgi:mRNA-degrading endonuclease RelE of RelBE toxin-antitoxin system